MTQKVDAYGFAMTCYEILIGQIPFFEYMKKDWERIIKSESPNLSKSPAFEVIAVKLKKIYDQHLNKPSHDIAILHMKQWRNEAIKSSPWSRRIGLQWCKVRCWVDSNMLPKMPPTPILCTFAIAHRHPSLISIFKIYVVAR